MSSQNKPKCVLSSGLVVLSHRQKTKDLVILSLFDFENSGRVVFDQANKQVLANPYNITFSAQDAEKVSEWLKT